MFSWILFYNGCPKFRLKNFFLANQKVEPSPEKKGAKRLFWQLTSLTHDLNGP